MLILLGAAAPAAAFSWTGTTTGTIGPTLTLTLSSIDWHVTVGTPLQMSLTSNTTGTFTVEATPGVCSTDTGGIIVFPSGFGGTSSFNVIGQSDGACSIAISNGSVKVVAAALVVSGGGSMAFEVPTLNAYTEILLISAICFIGLAHLRHSAKRAA